jgi:hypothetical protein
MEGLGRAKQDARAEGIKSRRLQATQGAVAEDVRSGQRSNLPVWNQSV